MIVPGLIRLIADGIELIGKLVKNRRVEDSARILDAVERIYDAITGVAAGSVTPEAARAELQRLTVEIEDNDAKADAAVDAKFDKEN